MEKAQSKAQFKYIIMLRSKYKYKEKAPEKYKWVFDKEWEKVDYKKLPEKKETSEEIHMSEFEKYLNVVNNEYNEVVEWSDPDDFDAISVAGDILDAIESDTRYKNKEKELINVVSMIYDKAYADAKKQYGKNFKKNEVDQAIEDHIEDMRGNGDDSIFLQAVAQ
jgi:hypothetical protein